MDILTLKKVQDHLTKRLFEYNPHGIMPSGEEVTPDYNDPASIAIIELLSDIQSWIEEEDRAIDEWYRREYVERYGDTGESNLPDQATGERT